MAPLARRGNVGGLDCGCDRELRLLCFRCDSGVSFNSIDYLVDKARSEFFRRGETISMCRFRSDNSSSFECMRVALVLLLKHLQIGIDLDFGCYPRCDKYRAVRQCATLVRAGDLVARAGHPKVGDRNAVCWQNDAGWLRKIL